MGGQGGRRGGGRRGGRNRRRAPARHRHRGGAGGFNIFTRQGGAQHGPIQRRLISSFICVGFGIGLIFYGIAASFIYSDFPWQGFTFIGVGVMLIISSFIGFWKVNQLYRLAQRQQEQQVTISASQGNFGSQLTTQQQLQQHVWTTGQNMTVAPPYGAGQVQPPAGYAASVGPQSYNSPMVLSQQPYPQPQAGDPVPYTQVGGVAPYPQYPTTPGGVQPFPAQTNTNEPQLYHVQPYSPDGNTQAPYLPSHLSQGPAPNNSSAGTMPPPSYDEVVIMNEQNNK